MRRAYNRGVERTKARQCWKSAEGSRGPRSNHARSTSERRPRKPPTDLVVTSLPRAAEGVLPARFPSSPRSRSIVVEGFHVSVSDREQEFLWRVLESLAPPGQSTDPAAAAVLLMP